DRVLEAGMLAIAAVAVIALDAEHVTGRGEHLIGPAETDDIGQARIRRRLAMRHAHAAADAHVEAGEPPFVDDGDEAEVVREHVDVVARRYRDRNLELARQIRAAVE